MTVAAKAVAANVAKAVQVVVVVAAVIVAAQVADATNLKASAASWPKKTALSRKVPTTIGQHAAKCHGLGWAGN